MLYGLWRVDNAAIPDYTTNTYAGMKEVELAGHKVRLYDSIDELPIVRFHKYNRFLLVDAGIGSDISDYDAHVERVIAYVSKGDIDNFKKEFENLRQNLFLIMAECSPKFLSFACLVESIDGQPQTDLSQEGLQKVLDTLGAASRREVTEDLSSVKKKIDDELALYFPALFDDVKTREYYDAVKNLTVKMLAQIYDGATEQSKTVIDGIREQLLLFSKPKRFTGRDGLEVTHDKEFATMCLLITKETGAEAKQMNVLEYYNAYDYIRQKARKTQNKAI
jgi:hypothetical protein